MNYAFRPAQLSELNPIWSIIQAAILRRKAEGSTQWQDGYPNLEVIRSDIQKSAAFVMTEAETIVGYCAMLINDEPAYENIQGKWLTQGDFIVFHRVAVSGDHLGKGLAKKMLGFIEEFARAREIYSIKADTNFDNLAMIAVFEKSGYKYCGEVYFRGSARRAYEKMLVKQML